MTKPALPQFMRTFPFAMLILSVLGLLASLILAIEKIHLLENPDAELSCSLNPVYTCESVINSPQASALGFPNEFLGIAFFGGTMALALALLAGAKFARWLHVLTWLGLVGSMAFVVWFFYQSVYVIDALCIYCTSVWFFTWTLFVVYSRWLITTKIIQIPKRYRPITSFFVNYTASIWLVFILILVGLGLNHFWYYYGQYF